MPRMEIFCFVLTRSERIIGIGKHNMMTSKSIESPE
jgi:hypothetical protein